MSVPGATPVIDVHTHYVPESARTFLARIHGGGPRLAALKAMTDDDPMVRVEHRLADMDQLGIDVGVVSLPPLGLVTDQAVLEGFLSFGNDGLVELCSDYPDKFTMMASLPLPNVGAAMAELNRLADRPAVRGVTFPAQASLYRPDQIGLEPLLARATELGLSVLIHPSGASIDLGAVFEDFGLNLAMHAMISAPLVALRMIAAGFFDRIPGLRVIVPNLGGVLPFLGSRFNDRLKGEMEKPPTEYLRTSIFYDSSGFPAGPAFRCALDAVGVSQIVFGTDYPSWQMSPLWNAVEDMNFDQPERQAVLGGNATRWFDPRRPRGGV